MRHQALHDPLTGLPNRALFSTASSTRCARAAARRARRSPCFPRPRPLQGRQRQPRPRGRRRAARRSSAPRLQHVVRAGGHRRPPRRRRVRRPAARTSTTRPRPSTSPSGSPTRSTRPFGSPRAARSSSRRSIGIALARRPHERRDAAARRRRRDVPRQGRAAAARYELFDEAMRERAVDAAARSRPTCAARSSASELARVLPADRRPRARGGSLGVEALVRWQHPERGLRRRRASSSPLAEETGLIVAARALGARAGLPRRSPTGARASGTPPARRHASTSRPPARAARASPRSCSGCSSAAALDARHARPRDHRERADRGRRRAALDARGAPRASACALAARRLRHRLLVARATCSASRSTRSRSTARSSTASAPSTSDTAIVARDRRPRPTALGLGDVAEGVETARAARARCAALGCDRAQGYLFAKPMCAVEFEELLAAGPVGPPPARRRLRASAPCRRRRRAC